MNMNLVACFRKYLLPNTDEDRGIEREITKGLLKLIGQHLPIATSFPEPDPNP